MATFQVTTRADVVNAGDGVLSLREAISQAASNVGADTITFSGSVFTPGNGTITLSQGQLAITQAGGAVTIRGDIDNNGTADVTIDAGGNSRVLDIRGGSMAQQANVTLDGLVITGGATSDADGAGIQTRLAQLTVSDSRIEGNAAGDGGSGGGLAGQNATVTLNGTTVSGNTAIGYSPTDGHYGSGGGVSCDAVILTVNDSSISGNQAVYSAGLELTNSTTTCTDSEVNGNTAVGSLDGGNGGIGAHGGSLDLMRTTVAGNSADGSSSSTGGGIVAAQMRLTLTDSTVTDNSAHGGTGSASGGGILAAETDIIITRSVISDNSASASDSAGGGGLDAFGGTLSIIDSQVTGNSSSSFYAFDSGGGISLSGVDATIRASTISGNRAGGSGGGIDASNGSLLLADCSITDNLAGGWYFGEASGGGIAGHSGTIVVSGTTISGNTAGKTSYGNYATYGHGGGISSDGDASWSVTNSTISGNTAASHDYGESVGGGIYVRDGSGSYMRITNSTIADNSASTGAYGSTEGGGIAGMVTLRNTILAGNAAAIGPDISGSITSNGHNLLSQGGIAGSTAGDIVVRPEDVFTSVIGALQDNGGPTLTHALLPGSVAINGGLNADAVDVSGQPLTADQRGASRVWDGSVDIGGFERAPLVIAGTSGADSLLGGGAADSISGLGGNDTILANAENDTVLGGTGNDSLDGMSGSDRVDGGDGADIVRGGVGNDTVLGGAGNDTMTAGDGNDSLDGNAGADSMIGGTGDDTYRVDSAGDVTAENASQGTDTVLTSITRALANNLENLTLTGTTAINGTGNGLANVITGNAGANDLRGLAGADRLTGGGGADVLTGGTEADVFDYNLVTESGTAASARDTIAGFDGVGAAAGDRIDLTDLFAGTLAFVSGGFTGLNQVHVIEGGSGNSLVEVNLSGGFAADFAILVQDGATVASAWRAADFLL